MKIYFGLLIIIISNSFVCPQDHWKKIAQPTDRLLRHVFFIDSLTGWCAGASGIIIHTTDGAISWTEQNSTVTTFIVDLFFLDKNSGWALTLKNVPPFGTTVLKTTNGGEDWIANDYPENDVFMTTVFYSDSLMGWLGGSTIAGTTDGGLSWQEANIDSNLISGFPVLNFSFYSAQFGYACGGFLDRAGVIWRTTDFGKNWSATGVSPDEVFDLFVFDSLNAITLSGDPEGFFGTGNIKSIDAGVSWDYAELPLTALSFAIDFRTSTEGWSASGYKFLFSLDRGENWNEIETPDSAVIFDLMFTDSLTGYAVGEKGVVLKYFQQPVNVNNDTALLPEEFILHQNYPNPFNSNTKIRFEIANLEFVTLIVYDVLGNEVATLVNEEKPVGIYEYEFSANIGGGELASGIYYYRLTSAGLGKTKKMVLLK